MENFNTLRSDNPNDVMKYLGEVMNRLSQIESENSLKDRQLYNYDLEVKRLQQENLGLRNQINYFNKYLKKNQFYHSIFISSLS